MEDDLEDVTDDDHDHDHDHDDKWVVDDENTTSDGLEIDGLSEDDTDDRDVC